MKIGRKGFEDSRVQGVKGYKMKCSEAKALTISAQCGKTWEMNKGG